MFSIGNTMRRIRRNWVLNQRGSEGKPIELLTRSSLAGKVGLFFITCLVFNYKIYLTACIYSKRILRIFTIHSTTKVFK
jgi:hypothetical protein